MNTPRERLQLQVPEYDIREIDEELYIAVLNCRLQSQSGI